MRFLKWSVGLVVAMVLATGGYLGVTVKRVSWKPLVQVGPVEPIVFEHVRVFTASDAGVLEDQRVVMAGGRIESVGPADDASAAPAGRRIDGRGMTLLPGLIDSHVHLINTAAPTWYLALPDPKHNLEASLYAGVTSVVSMGDDVKQLAKLVRQVEDGAVPGPRVVFAGSPLTRTGGHPEASKKALVPKLIQLGLPAFAEELDSPEQAEGIVARQLGAGASLVKMVVDDLPGGQPRLEEAHLRAIVEAAHRHGVKAVAHVGSADDALLAAKVGVDALNHLPNLGPMSAEQVAQFADAGIPVVPTMIIFERTAQFGEHHFTLDALDRAVEAPEILEQLSDDVCAKNEPNPFLTPWLSRMAKARGDRANTVAAMSKAGVTILVGTDSSILGNIAGSSMHHEMELLVKSGVPVMDVLLGATVRSARFFFPGLPVGTIEPGQLADVVLVEGNPLDDIANTRRIKAVVSRGRWVERL